MGLGSMRANVLVVISSSIGPAVLSLPKTMYKNGIITCLIVLVLCSFITIFQIGLLMRSSQRAKSFESYPEIIRSKFGKKIENLL